MVFVYSATNISLFFDVMGFRTEVLASLGRHFTAGPPTLFALISQVGFQFVLSGQCGPQSSY